MLYDKNFLISLDQYPHKVVYARITSLTFQETPIEYIEGRVTQGSINIDGSSAVRRTCSLTIAAPEFDYDNYYWGLNTKFKVEIGIENHVNPDYPDIIWFKQGVFLITSFSTSRNANSFSISIQGKDKMCLLNGDVNGSLESSVDFGTIEEEDVNGNWNIRQIPVQDIIRNIVHNYGGEPYHNIIINDLDTIGLELLEYRYDTDLYLYRQIDNNVYDGGLLDGSKKCNVYNHKDECVENNISLDDLTVKYLESLTDDLVDIVDRYYIKFLEGDDNKYYVTKVSYGQTAGYREVDLVYAGDLIANVGESLTSVLDKIVKMLVEFEYFYNLDGQFVFQKKQSFKETIWQFNSDTKTQQKTLVDSNYAYEFHGSNLITSFNNNPNLLNLKNDYSIWGQRQSVSGAEIPIHLRYAIDKKPMRYTSISVKCADKDDEDYEVVKKYNDKYNTKVEGQESITTSTDKYDWREIIYQMSLDYYQYNFLDDFELRVAAANPIDYPTGRTGYEQYYIDLYSFWRDLYYPHLEKDIQDQEQVVNDLENTVNNLTNIIFGENGIEVDLKHLLNGEVDFNTLIEKYKEIKDDNNNPITDITIFISELNTYFEKQQDTLKQKQYKLELEQGELEILKVKQKQFYDENNQFPYWNSKVYETPEELNFWFDFLDSSGELAQFNVKTIGSRSKSINDTNIKSIYFRETPAIIYCEAGSLKEPESGYRYIQVADFDHMFSCSSQGKSAKDKLDELIYQHSYCVESATIATVPIYYLEPNTRIYLHDEDTGLEGDYIVSKISIPLGFNGTMSITATKAAENILY